MTAPHLDRPSIPLSWYEQDTFNRLTSARPLLPARLSPRAWSGTRRTLRRLARSRSVRQSVDAAFWPAVMCAGLVLGFFLLFATRGQYMAWDGPHSIPTGGIR